MNITGMHKGDMVLNGDISITGMVCGRVTVKKKAKVEVSGVITGHLWVEEDGSLVLTGMATDGLTNNGGNVDIYGTVTGGLKELSGVTNKHDGSLIK
ncbi:hypothetical protein [Pantoea sp. BAV 3049]|uniref:hypothetical protein n=1 Tax=Pantoea sp. BAV 3049 TaxID=2654188 RepID=UPI00131DFEA2|nr:hypothetical protein [Pantoea sp. BAV 3049]